MWGSSVSIQRKLRLREIDFWGISNSIEKAVKILEVLLKTFTLRSSSVNINLPGMGTAESNQ